MITFKKSFIASLVGAAALTMATSAQAFIIQAGAFKMTIDSYDAGTTYTTGQSCNTVGGCDLLPGQLPAPGAVGSEDSWGIFSIASIINTAVSPNSQWFSRGTDGYLLGIFEGLSDQDVSVSGNLQTTYSTGGTIRVYQRNVDYLPSVQPGVVGGRAAVEAMITGGSITPWLTLSFAPGVDDTTPGLASTYTNIFNLLALTGNPAFVGSGAGYLNVTGGTEFVRFNTNSILNTNTGLFVDAKFTDTLRAINFAGSTDVGGAAGWTVGNSSDVIGEALPEPGTLALLGLGLGLAGLSRRRLKVN